MISAQFLNSYFIILWKVYKFFERRFVYGTHEIYRICTQKDPNSPVGIIRVLLRLTHPPAEFDATLVYRLDRSLMYSTQLAVARRMLEGSDCVDVKPIYRMILERKFPPNACASATTCLNRGVIIIWEINQLLHRINTKASTKYDSTVKAHEQKLYELHKNLLNKLPTQRITKEWQILGFQGNDPSTDFRGMGKLALDELHYYSKLPSGKLSWSESGGDDGYSWAICGIKITQYQLQLLRSRKMHQLLFQWHFKYELDKEKVAGDVIDYLTQRYYELYAWMFEEYHLLWKIFVERKQEEYSARGKKLIPVLLHNEFFAEYKQRIEKTLLFSQ